MISRILKSSLKTSLVCRRSIYVTAPGRVKDPVYQVFLDKVREYRLKSPTGKPVDPPPELEVELKEALEKLALRYGGGDGVDLLEFPKFKMPDIDIDPISINDLPENKKQENKNDRKDEDPKEAKSKSGAKDKKDQKDDKEKKGEKAKKAKDDKKTKPKDGKEEKK